MCTYVLIEYEIYREYYLETMILFRLFTESDAHRDAQATAACSTLGLATRARALVTALAQIVQRTAARWGGSSAGEGEGEGEGEAMSLASSG